MAEEQDDDSERWFAQLLSRMGITTEPAPGGRGLLAAAREPLEPLEPQGGGDACRGRALLVVLHGLGASEVDLLDEGQRLVPSAVVVGLRAPVSHGYRGGFSWWETDGSGEASAAATEGDGEGSVAAALEAVLRFLDAAPAHYRTDASRTVHRTTHTLLLGLDVVLAPCTIFVWGLLPFDWGNSAS